MKILIDENMPYALTLFSAIGEVVAKSGREICADDLVDVDALMIRSVTQVNQTLLSKANRLKFIGTATAGMDHVDQDLLTDKGIHFTAAAGCNKVGVAEYVISSLLVLTQQQGQSLFDKTVGIVGVGQVGTYLAKCLNAIGVKTLLNDPPKQEQLRHAGQTENAQQYVSLDELLAKADVVSLHTPLTRSGEHPSYHLLDEKRLNQMRGDQILINAARGAVVDNLALKQRLLQNDGFTAVLDVFEHEPNVDIELLPLLAFATPHIAGYGLEGKARGTSIIYNLFCQFLGKDEQVEANELLPSAPIPVLHLAQGWRDASQADHKAHNQRLLHNLTQLIYDVRQDDNDFRRAMMTSDVNAQAKAFDQLRKNYWDRREYSAIRLLGESSSNDDLSQADLSQDQPINLTPFYQLGFNE